MRGPDFVIVGAMKAGTTSLFRWLEDHPGVGTARDKEPRFFSDEAAWSRGWDWYLSLFERPAKEALVGEASVEYTDPDLARIAAGRMVEKLPEVRIVYLVRHPLERMASHYRHQVQRGRETRPYETAVRDPAYAGRSRYFTCLEPYLDRFERVLVVRTEDLEEGGWRRVQEFLGLEVRPAPEEAYNVTGAKEQYTKPMLWLFDHGLTDLAKLVPRPLRSMGRRLLTKDDGDYRSLLESAKAPVPAEVSGPIWEDVARLEELLGSGRMWER
jgi:hypothetical protein